MWSNSHILICVLLTLFSKAFSFQLKHQSTSKPIAFYNTRTITTTRSLELPRLFSSFSSDGSEYSSNDKKDTDDDDESASGFGGGGFRDEDETATVELQPIPTSKNSGNRFVAFVWDQVLDNIYGSGSSTSTESEPKDALDLHYDRMQHTEDHVMFCRKTNLYNDTFNTDSMVDILWSLPMYVPTVDTTRLQNHARMNLTVPFLSFFLSVCRRI
jgi:hypothetical protein